MKILLILTFILAGLFTPVHASNDAPTSPSETIVVDLEILQKDNNSKTHRIPMRVIVEVLYNPQLNLLEIHYAGEAQGEVLLYKDGILIDTSEVINCTIPLPTTTGQFTIQIVTNSWCANGILSL